MYTYVDRGIPVSVADEAKCDDAELSGAVTAPSNTFLE